MNEPTDSARTSTACKTTEYRIEDPKITHAQADKAPRRTMDCVDCHNRVGHNFETPDSASFTAALTRRFRS